ncbi:Chain length determinant protein [compost metagenome]|uniref:LPS O-antigen chain length determinant protein WzzB n=1 Tax=Pseudomonas vranovensis TaxID=321661 RepID=UPI00041FF23C|nr:Wzz/FepE/Etk N-terminal domain-containing protein [Pseudomonas vranovensis]
MVSERLVQNDEIDLTEVFKGLWRQKLLILLCAVVVFLAAAGYAWKATPIYEAELIIQPPTQNDIANLNFGRGGDSGLGFLQVKEVYAVYLAHLQSETLRWELYRKLYMPSLTDAQRGGSQNSRFTQFSNSLIVEPVRKDDPTRFSITSNVADPKQAVEWVEAFAALASDKAKEEVLKNIKSDALVKADNLEKQIDHYRASSRKEREDQIVQLKEALRVAKSIGLEKPPIISGRLAAEVSSGMDSSLMYMRGTKALEAEIENLESRQSDDPFISHLRQNQESIAFYRTLEINPASVTVFRQDGIVDPPDQPIKPRKLMIMALGLVLGLGLGVFVALVRFFLSERMGSRRAV